MGGAETKWQRSNTTVDNADAEAGGAYCKYFYMTMPHRRKCGISRPPAYAPTEPGRPDFLKGFTSWLHADRYFVYHRLSHTIQEISRWTHLCRKSGKAVRDLQEESAVWIFGAEGTAISLGTESKICGFCQRNGVGIPLTRSEPGVDAL